MGDARAPEALLAPDAPTGCVDEDAPREGKELPLSDLGCSASREESGEAFALAIDGSDTVSGKRAFDSVTE